MATAPWSFSPSKEDEDIERCDNYDMMMMMMMMMTLMMMMSMMMLMLMMMKIL